MDSPGWLMNRKVFGVISASIFLVLFFAFSGHGAEMKIGLESRDMKSRVFARITETASALETISSDFTQERYTSMLKEPLISMGRFIYEKPDRLYWEINKPSPTGFTVSGGKARRWEGSPSEAETFRVDKEPVIKAIVEQVFAWSRADFPWLEKRYIITVMEDTKTLLKLIPRSTQEKKYLTHLYIAFSGNWDHVSSVEVHEKGGDYTRIIFLGTLINKPLPKSIFEQ
jgi:outer membrane lipoprotein-sorting protein